jgi:hypothetical protein
MIGFGGNCSIEVLRLVEVYGVLLCFAVAGLVWKLIETLFVFGLAPGKES